MPKEQVATEIDANGVADYMRNEMMMIVRSEMQKPWPQMTQDEQERKVARVEFLCRDVVRKCVEAIASSGRDVVRGTLGALAVDKNRNFVTKITFDALADGDKLAVIDHINRGVHLILMDSEEYAQSQERYETEPDEPGLPLEDQQPDWPVVAAAIKDEGPEVIDMDDPEAMRAAGLTPPEDDDGEDIPPVLRRQQPRHDAPDAHEAEEDEVAAAPGGDLIDEDDEMTAEELDATVRLDPATAKVRPAPRARGR